MSLSEAPHGHPRGEKTPPPGPFGFTFTEPLIPPLDTPYEPAPALPPGPALLDDTESNMLDSFFTSMDSNQPDNNDFWFTFGDPMNGDTNFTFDWPDLPPTFEGSTTSLPSQPLALGREGVPADKGNPLSSDVVAAASMLYQNGNDFTSTFSNQIYTEHGLEEVNQSNPDVRRSRFESSGKQPIQQQPSGNAYKDVPYLPRGVHTNKMIFDPGSHPVDEIPLEKYSYLRWGSDAGFVDQGYLAPPDQPSMEERTTDLLHNLGCLESQSSAAPTRAPSPDRKVSTRYQTEWSPSKNTNSLKSYAVGDTGVRIDDNSRPTKRQKGKGKTKEEDANLDAPFGGSPIHPRSTMKARAFSPDNDRLDNLSRRSKLHGAVAKPPRENLTEDQKRANHILSEQKRRNLIKQGFEDLCVIVPQLQGGGYSKSTMLTQAANWLEELLQGNELLKAQLAELKAQQGE